MSLNVSNSSEWKREDRKLVFFTINKYIQFVTIKVYIYIHDYD